MSQPNPNSRSSNENPSNDSPQQNNPHQAGGLPPFSGPRDPSFPLAGLPENTETIRMDSENHEDRRSMRKWLFGVLVIASILFLLMGAVMAILVTCNMLQTKQEVKSAMLEVVKDSSPAKISEFINTAKPAPPESVYHARETAKKLISESADQRNTLIEKFLEATNWLSLSPMITLVAFILGVGLTLAIALMRALFREEEQAKSNTLAQLATPVSKLVEYLIEYLQSKFKR